MSRGLGPVQLRVLDVLAQGHDGEWAAIERSELKRLVGGDRANARRAIRTLVERGDVWEIRAEGGRAYYFPSFAGVMVGDPAEPDTAPPISGWRAAALGLLHGPWVVA